MQFKSLEAVSQKLPEHTYWLLVCLDYQYAMGFMERGTVRFGRPSEWQLIKDNTLRGDELEGVYASMIPGNLECEEFLGGLRPSSTCFQKEDRTFFLSEEIMDMRVYCMYGLHDFNMPLSAKRSQDHKFHQSGVIPFSYFKNLYPEWNKDNYEGSDNIRRPMVLLINPINFRNLMIKRLKELGVRDEEILYKPVSYTDFYDRTFILEPYGQELFCKHIAYKEQSEVRFVIDTRRKEVKELFDKSDGKIDLGPIDDEVALLSKFYFEDVQVEIRGKEMLYSLAEPEVFEVDSRWIIGVIRQTLNDELPNSPLSIEEIEAKLTEFVALLKEKGDASYDRATHEVMFEGKRYGLASTSGAKIIEHYRNYMDDGDLAGASDCIAKFHHFFPMYDMEYYFEDYYQKTGDELLST